MATIIVAETNAAEIKPSTLSSLTFQETSSFSNRCVSVL